MFSRLWIIFLWSKQSVLDFGLAAYCLNWPEYAFFMPPNPVFPLTATTICSNLGLFKPIQAAWAEINFELDLDLYN